MNALTDIPDWYTPEAAAADAMFSIDDYGKADDGPYQIVQPAYPAPQFLQRFTELGHALRECKTLCRLKGRPFRVVRWGREGSGARGGVPCVPCGAQSRARISRFPRRVSGCLEGFPDAMPVAEFRPDGQRIVYDGCGVPKLVGAPNYIVSHTPFPRFYRPEVYPQRYLQAVKTAQILAGETGRRVYICSNFGAKCPTKGGRWVPVVYVNPGGLDKVDPNTPTGTVTINPVSQAYFRELLMESAGGTYLGQGA